MVLNCYKINIVLKDLRNTNLLLRMFPTLRKHIVELSVNNL